MSKKRLSMRKIKEVLRLKFEVKLSNRKIAESCDIARSTVSEYLRRFEATDQSWPLPAKIDELSLGRLLFPPAPSATEVPRPLPDWPTIHADLKKKSTTHVTLFLLWQE